MSRSLVIKVTCGAEDPERCNQALTVAATAAVTSVAVSLWLTGEAAWLAVPGRSADLKLPHAPPASELIETVRAVGTITVCSQCALRRSLAETDLLDGVRIAGASVFVEEVLREHSKALVY